MASVTIDLPADLLEEVSRLAQERNVPRADVYRLAVAAFAGSLAQEAERSRAVDAAAAARRGQHTAERAAGTARATVIRLSEEIEALRRERDLGVRQARTATVEIRRLNAEASAARTAARDAEQRRDEAERAARDLAERDRQKILAVMRDQEVAALRRRHQELAVVVQKLEEDLVYQRMDADLKTRKLAGLERQLETALRQRGEFEAGFKREQQETFKSERQIGKLLQERARLRDELKRLAGLINRPPGAPARRPDALTARAGKVQSKP